MSCRAASSENQIPLTRAGRGGLEFSLRRDRVPLRGRWSQDRFDNGKSEGAVPIEEAGIWESGEMGSFGEGDQFPADEKACERCSRSVNSCPSS